MLRECLEVFQKQMEEKGEQLILDSYILVDGSYVIVGKDGTIKSVLEIRLNKKTREVEGKTSGYADVCYYDYHSRLISMNKPQDPGKIIHSNNYLSFWIKKESVSNGKLTPAVIDKYYEILQQPEKKYEKSKGAELYNNIKETLGEVDREALQKYKTWILEHIFSMEDLECGIDMEKKDYLKVFFEAERSVFEKEGNRYFVPNIYNNNNYNIMVNSQVLGLPDNNQGMNVKKPFLAVKTRKCAAPYLLNGGEVMLQKQFFDYLMNFASVEKNNLYVDLNKGEFIPCGNGEYPPGAMSGFFLRIQKGKEVEIHDQDVVPFFENKLDPPFELKNVLEVVNEKHPEYAYRYHGEYDTRKKMEEAIDEVFFSKMLKNNYFSPEEDISIQDEILKRNLLSSRRKLFSWLHLGHSVGIRSCLDKLSLELVKGSILNGYMGKAVQQINLRLSLLRYLSEGGNEMGDFSVELRNGLKEKIAAKEPIGLENDREYYFAVGQIVGYLIFLSRAAKKSQSLINPFLNATEDTMIKRRILQYYKRYNHAIVTGAKKASRLYEMVMAYVPEQPVMQDIISIGFTINNLLLEKEDKENE